MIDKITKETIDKDINKLIRMIKYCRSRSRYEVLVDEILMLYDLCDSINYDEVASADDFSYKTFCLRNDDRMYQLLNSNIKSNKELNENLNDMANHFITEESVNKSSEMETKNKIHINDCYLLAFDFFSELDSKLKETLEKQVSNDRIIVTNSFDSEGYAVTYPSLGDFDDYILLFKRENINDAYSIVHEISHVYDNKLNSNFSSKARLSFENLSDEIFSHFIELLFTDYLDKINYNKHEVEIQKTNYNQRLLHFCYYLNEVIDREKDVKDASTYETCHKAMCYGYGLSFAYYFYDLYKKDPEYAKKEIHNFLRNKCVMNIKDSLKLSGCDSLDFSKSKVLEKHISEYF